MKTKQDGKKHRSSPTTPNQVAPRRDCNIRGNTDIEIEWMKTWWLEVVDLLPFVRPPDKILRYDDLLYAHGTKAVVGGGRVEDWI